MIAVLFVAFAAGNHDTVSIGLFPLPYTIELPKFLMAIVCFGMGAFIGCIAMSLRFSSARRQFSAEHKRVAALENELKSARAHAQNLPSLTPKT